MKNKLFILTVIILALFVTCSKILESEDKEVKLSGTVKNYFTGENIANAALTLTGESIEEVTGLSDSSGAFTLITEIEETSQLSLEISKESYYSKAMDIEVEPGKERKLGSLLLQPDYDSLTVSGQVVDGLNNEPVQDVQLITEITEELVTTNENGYFSFDIEVNQSSSSNIVFQKQYFINDTVQVDLEPEQDVEVGKITMYYELDPAHLRGTVYNNRSDTTINRVKVSIEEYDKVYGYTDESGSFDLAVQINAAQDITVNFGKYPYEGKSIKVDPISPEDDLNLGKIKLVPPAYESLTVTGKVVTSDQQPLENAEVRCEILDDPVTTNASGQFEFDVKVDSIRSVELMVTKQYFQDSNFTITLHPEQDYQVDPIQLDYKHDPALISGQVFNDRADTTLSEIKVSIEGQDQVYTHTDSNGEFELPVQINTAQTINVVFSKYPYETKTITIDPISPEDEIDLEEIRLVPPENQPLTVSGRVVDSRGQEPIENVEIISTALKNSFTTSSTGYFEFDLLVDEITTTNFVFSKEYFLTDTMVVTFNPEQDQELGNIELDYQFNKARIKGKILDNRSGDVIPDAKVLLSQTGQYTTSNDSGDFSFDTQI
ncbi:MAG TPA: carboxypeptidase regulatory-like domain-containing protein, partial [bacterium]|nr:carboxypeptidase regulatory-like domain-containing protein [bacterium]